MRADAIRLYPTAIGSLAAAVCFPPGLQCFQIRLVGGLFGPLRSKYSLDLVDRLAQRRSDAHQSVIGERLGSHEPVGSFHIDDQPL